MRRRLFLVVAGGTLLSACRLGIGEAPPEEAQFIPLRILTYSEIVHRGKEAILHAASKEGSELTPALMRGEETIAIEEFTSKMAGDDGYVRWTWTVPETLEPGTYTIVVTAVAAEGEISWTEEFEVR
ncbi:MAG: hypothetical protein OXE05_14555 [Chloroflexi bacterium]|nr:hypothetical protein [Chloroflexota bacterium]